MGQAQPTTLRVYNRGLWEGKPSLPSKSLRTTPEELLSTIKCVSFLPGAIELLHNSQCSGDEQPVWEDSVELLVSGKCFSPAEADFRASRFSIRRGWDLH